MMVVNDIDDSSNNCNDGGEIVLLIIANDIDNASNNCDESEIVFLMVTNDIDDASNDRHDGGEIVLLMLKKLYLKMILQITVMKARLCC